MSIQVVFVLLLLAVLSHRAHSTCVQYQSCDDIEETLKAIASDPQNVQQLEKLFYPVNGRNLHSYAIIVYFLNYTGPLPRQCDAGSYPWDSYPAVNTTYQEMEWYLWTTQVINAITSPLKLLGRGLYLPTVIIPFFNQKFPIAQPTPTACLAVPYRETPPRNMLTIELFSIISPQQYTAQLLDEHDQGVFSNRMEAGIPEHDVRIYSRLRQNDNGKTTLDLRNVISGIQWICGLGGLLLVYHYGESWLRMLKGALEEHRGRLAVFWATVNVCLVLNIYTILKIIANTCIKGYQNCWYGVATILIIFLFRIPVIIHFRKFKHHLPPPRMWLLCFPRNCFTLGRLYFLLSSWIMCFTVIVTPAVHIPYAILLLSTNYLLYGTVLVAIYLLLPTAICLTALVYTIDQMFSINTDYRLTCRQGLQQVYHLLLAAVTFIGTAAFAVSIHLLLHLSKNGDKTQSISTTVFVVFSTVFSIVAPWAIKTAVRKMQQALAHEWEAIQEQ